MKIHTKEEFYKGLMHGIPIALGYIPVSFTFGLMAVKGGIPALAAILISMTNLTSAGQFAGMNLIIEGASLVEIALTTLIVNLRYMLMSISLSQKLSNKIPAFKKYILAFGITDEVFAVSAVQPGEVTSSYMSGLVTLPYIGWTIGTIMGALASSLLPQMLQNSMGIALYCMFIAIVVPAAKKSIAALAVALIAIFISSLFTWAPLISSLSAGWVIIIATVVASSIGAIAFPREDDECD
ncbi:AzlC family ABC transporter permease [Tepidanaerobacter syntrophicus]|uniref:4-azaleucine resistance probable transporter AzlC n=1 Tax=Tepidanaerobacter syntrophicus TaxID=224999 RepID=A0A0U9HGA1_9FIRM|nr:AzlC family ABC transporter permease [Tepidanaerobacter syntrophicus]GAQ24916.1 4-azaleucine resistance probable transporter AzlC [Tepidanaerobacter syntrophicus]